MKKIILLVMSVFLLNACSNNAEKAVSTAKAQRLTVVSSGVPKNVLPSFNTFSWRNEYSLVLSATDAKNETEIKTHLKTEIIHYLQSKGYVFQPDPIQADVIVGFLFALDDDIADADIKKRFGMLPGISAAGVDSSSYKKGTLLLEVLDNRLSQIYWRSAMQGFVELEKDKNDPDTKRIQYILSIMMGDFPNAGQ